MVCELYPGRTEQRKGREGGGKRKGKEEKRQQKWETVNN